MRLGIGVAAIGLLAGCATPEPVELSGFCRLDDPASEWILEKKIARQAREYCSGDYRIRERKEIKYEFGHEYRWLVDCAPENLLGGAD